MINVSGYDVIYQEIVYKCVDINLVFGEDQNEIESVARPKFIDACCVDQDGEIVILHDEAFMFRFIRKGGTK